MVTGGRSATEIRYGFSTASLVCPVHTRTNSSNEAKTFAQNNPAVDNLIARASIHSYDVALYVGAGFFLAAIPVIAMMIRDKPENLIEGSEQDARIPVAV